MESRTLTLLLAALTLVAVAQGAGKFEQVPDAAMTALKGTRGKPFTSGLVFSNGGYVKPPYRVIRYGTAIFVNDEQITDQIVSWKSFLTTQDGYVAPVATPAKPVEKKSVDDLFDDEPAAKPATPAAAPSAPAAAADSLSGTFTANPKSDALLKKVNVYRTEIQRKLRDGNLCFFGARYPRIVVEPRVAKALLDVLPEAIRDASDGASLAADMRAKGFVFMRRELCEDLVEHRTDYPQLLERRRALKEESDLQRMFQNARRTR